jgi:hypothetical protein
MKSNQPGKGRYGHLNRFIFNGLISGLLAIVIIFSGPVQAEEKRHHEAHEHGVASLNVAVEGNNIYIEFSSPAANVVGFEHHPRTHDQKDAVKDAVKKLQEGDALFILSSGSESKLVKSSVDTDIDKDADHHSESEHGHGEEEHHDQEEHHDKEHSEAEEHERHSEFEAQYHFVCKKPDRLSQIDVKLFGVFPGIEHIEVQLITETKQTAVELTAKRNKISL